MKNLTSLTQEFLLQQQPTNRRNFLKRSIVVGTGGIVATQAPTVAAAERADRGDYHYEVTRTDEEWLAQLGPENFKILREDDTEWPKSSPLWNDYTEGKFACSGCGLPNYESRSRVVLDKGWVFFSNALPDSILMGIHGEEPNTSIEVHCRRCSSHMGHLIAYEGKVIHCVNGVSLEFTPNSVG